MRNKLDYVFVHLLNQFELFSLLKCHHDSVKTQSVKSLSAMVTAVIIFYHITSMQKETYAKRSTTVVAVEMEIDSPRVNNASDSVANTGE